MAIKVSTRSNIAPFHVMEVVRKAVAREESGLPVVHLEVGQPSTPAPRKVLERAHQLLDENRLGYEAPPGPLELRTAIARHYEDWYGLSIPPSRVSVTVGASGACGLAFLTSFDSGDRVVVPSPGYPCYRNMLEAFEVDPVDLPVGAETRFQPTPELLDALVAQSGPVDGLIIASPSNPAGTMLTAAELEALAAWCDAQGVRLISDEIYHGLSYGTTLATAVQFNADAIVVNSFSKYFSMTGWRLGWMIVPEELAEPVAQLGANLLIGPPTLSQLAAVAAFDSHSECEANVARYTQNRQILLDGLPAVGLDRLAPADGAFYIYAQVDHVTEDSQDLCTEWLDTYGLAVTPGIDFDRNRGHQFVRFSFAGAPEDMHAALRILAQWHADQGQPAL